MMERYCDSCCGPISTPSARLSAAEHITASGVRSSCDTAEMNSICIRARFCARWLVMITMSKVTASRTRTPKLMLRSRRRLLATMSSSEPRRGLMMRYQSFSGGVVNHVKPHRRGKIPPRSFLYRGHGGFGLHFRRRLRVSVGGRVAVRAEDVHARVRLGEIILIEVGVGRVHDRA